MKKIQFLLIFIIILTPVAFADEAAIWLRLYERAADFENKYLVLQNIANTEDRALIPVFLAALNDTNSHIIVEMSRQERRYFDEIQRISIMRLGDFRFIEAEDAIHKAYTNTDNLLVRAEAITALGRMGSVKFIDEFITALRNINMRVDGNIAQHDNEAIAFALVNYFEMVRDIRSYEVVFYASVGWYSPRSGIRENARRALAVITDNPFEILKRILETDADFNNKITALAAMNDSAASDEQKSNLAVVGLREGLRHQANTPAENMLLSRLRLLSCSMLLNSSHKPPEALPYLSDILFGGIDNQRHFDASERLAVIEVLNTYRSNESVEMLIRYLRHHNTRQANNITSRDRRTVIATINALGDSENRIAVEELIAVTTIRWDVDVIRATQAALEKLRR
ncbi:MAG: HEAT repeat domain-containing protein [Spirochaetes bacterium]|nr:HEAT repeat domain-containing protein [Spirochaetota bacterium]